MIAHLVQFLVVAISVLLAAKVVPGIKVRSFGSAFVFAIVLALLNKLLMWLLVLLSIPFIILTLGLWVLVLDAVLWMLADKVVDGVELSGFGAAFFGSLVTTIISWAIVALIH